MKTRKQSKNKNNRHKNTRPRHKRSTRKSSKTIKRRGGAIGDASGNANIIDKLNAKIQSKCSNLMLKLDYRKNLQGKLATYSVADATGDMMVLCLYNTLYDPMECVSSIEYKLEETNKTILYITSKTKDTEQGKKYNTLLRACSIVLANHWGFQRILSNAENPISVWLLTKEYEFDTDNDFKTFRNNRKITQTLLQEYWEDDPEFTYVDVYVLINDKNVKRAYELIDTTPFICGGGSG